MIGISLEHILVDAADLLGESITRATPARVAVDNTQRRAGRLEHHRLVLLVGLDNRHELERHAKQAMAEETDGRATGTCNGSAPSKFGSGACRYQYRILG